MAGDLGLFFRFFLRPFRGFSSWGLPPRVPLRSTHGLRSYAASRLKGADPLPVAFCLYGVSTCLDHTLHVVVGPRTPSHEPPVRHRIDLYGVLKQAVEQQSARP